ncbi:MAG: anti-sigma factor [Pseudomonadota bacterium]
MDEREHIAAERALGHAPTVGETADEARLREAWEARLAPLLERIAPVDPPAGVFDRALSALDAPGDGVSVVRLRRQLVRWRGVAGAAVAAAAALALYVAVPKPAAEAGRYVAVVTADDDGRTGLVVQIDLASGVATVIPAGAAPPEGSSYEMWHLAEGETRPVSLGLLPREAVLRRGLAAGEGDLFAISLEPQGGSPTGQPTTPLYHGTVVRAD